MCVFSFIFIQLSVQAVLKIVRHGQAVGTLMDTVMTMHVRYIFQIQFLLLNKWRKKQNKYIYLAISISNFI